MVTRSDLIEIIKEIIEEHSKTVPEEETLRYQKVIDEQNGVFQFRVIGWEDSKHIYGSIFDLELIGEKIWIHHDGTRGGIAKELEERGVPKNKIILAWIPPSRRKHTEYAIT